MRRKTAILLALAVVVSTFGAQAYVTDTGPSPVKSAQAQQHASVPDPVSPNDAHANQARDRATALQDQMRAQNVQEQTRFRQRFVSKAERLEESAKTGEDGWDGTVAARGAAVNARVAIAHQEAKQGDLTESEIRREAKQLRNELDSFERRTSYRAESTTRAVVLVGEIETSLTSAEGWLDQIDSVLARDDISKAKRLAYAAGALEGARGNLEDARLLHEQYRSETQSGTSQKAAIEERYETIHESVQSQLESVSYAEDAYATAMVEKARGHFDRAETRYEDDYKAAALLDLLHAQQYLAAAEATSGVDAPEQVTDPASEEQIYDAKQNAVESLNATVEGTDNGVVLLLLGHAERQIVGGNEDLEWTLEHPDKEAQQKAYARYVAAKSLADNAEDTATLLEASGDN